MDIKAVIVLGNPGFPPAFDLSILDGDLVLDDGLETALILSIFTDRRALDDDPLPDPNGDKRGWWGDTYSPINADKVGSRLWLLERERDLKDVPLRAEQYLREAVQWLLDDGVVERIDCKAERPRPGMLSFSITVWQPGITPRQFQFNHFWRG